MSEKARGILAWINLGLNTVVLILLIVMFVVLSGNTRDIRNNFNEAEKQITEINNKIISSKKAMALMRKELDATANNTLLLRDGSLTIAEFVDRVDTDLSDLWDRVNKVTNNYATHLQTLH